MEDRGDDGSSVDNYRAADRKDYGAEFKAMVLERARHADCAHLPLLAAQQCAIDRRVILDAVYEDQHGSAGNIL